MRSTSLHGGVFRFFECGNERASFMSNVESANQGAEHAVIYIRVSTDRQVQGASLETQERDCRLMCERNGWEVVRLFREEGESAKTADRPQLQELLTYCRVSKPRPDYVVVHHVDRWARSGQDHDMMRNFLIKMGVKLRSYCQRLGEDPYDQFYERIMSGQAELDNQLRGMRSLAGMKTRVQGGRWTFKAPLGYVNGVDAAGNKTLLPESDRAHLISQAFELFATALYTKEQVRARANALGLRSVNGKPLSAETFSRMLRNPRYAGILSVNGWDVRAEGDYLPLVTVEVFQRVQQILAGRRVNITARSRNNPDFPLRNFVRCGHCQKPLTASWSTGKMGVKYAYYRCQNRICESPVNVRRQEMEDAFVGFLRQQQPDSGYLCLFHKVVLDVWNAKQADSVALVHGFENQVSELKERKRKLNEAFVFQQTITREDYDQMRTPLNEELAVAELNLGRARLDEVEIEKVLDFSENLLLNTAEAWRKCSLEQKQRLQQVLFPQGVEYGDGVYRTQEMSFLFKGLEGAQSVGEGFGSATGNRTRV
jgi:site-specific DNA recombinase